MIDLAAAFRAVVGALDLVEAEYVVVGSTAAASLGVARATRDVDLVAVIPASAVGALVYSLERDDLYVRSTEVALGVSSWISTPEDVILSKLRWRLESRSEVQWRDCVEIAAIQQLDREYLDRWSPALGVVEDLTELLDAVS